MAGSRGRGFQWRSGREERWQAAQSAQGIERTLSGQEFCAVRQRCGYSAREFAEFLKEIGAPITTTRTVYRLESEREVPGRYVDALRAFVGTVNFDRMLVKFDEEAEARRRHYEKVDRRTAELRNAKRSND